MQKVNDKLYNWASVYDEATIRQAEMTARLPFVERVALMPDMHLGKGSTVGSVIGTNGALSPATCGVDLGCGCSAIRFDLTKDQLPDSLAGLMPMIEKAVPAGVGQGHERAGSQAHNWLASNLDKFTSDLDSHLTSKAVEQYGTLGSGNHVLCFATDEHGHVWLVVHSGSRGLGNILASRHVEVAKRLNEAEGRFLESKDLAYFYETDAEFGMYIGDMLACQDYAAANRAEMVRNSVMAFNKFLGYAPKHLEAVQCHHNYTEKETHGGRELWITRKGAVSAQKGELGVILGSMGNDIYVVEGLGNPDSYSSCSHGAGRVLSRSAAKRQFTADDLIGQMEGVVWNHDRAKSLVDEIPNSYKNLQTVMDDQADLVKPVFYLQEIFNFKG